MCRSARSNRPCGAGLQFGAPDEDADDVIDERRITVKQILHDVGSALRWDYDYE